MTDALLVVGGGWPFRARASFYRAIAARGLRAAVADLWHAEGLTGADVPIPCRVLAAEEVRTALAGRAGLRLRGVTALQDVGLVAAAQLAEGRGLPGPSVAGARAVTDKALQRELLSAAGLRVPRWCTARSAAEAMSAATLFDAAVLKPVRGTASHGVRLVSTGDEAKRAYAIAAAGAQDGAVLVEEYVEGPEFSVESVSAAGTHHAVAFTRKACGPLPYFVELSHDTAVTADAARILGAAAEAALRAVGFAHGVSHTEVRLADKGPVVIEVNGRPGGDLIPMLHALTGRIDLHDAAVALALGEPVPEPKAATGSAAIRYLTADQVLKVRAWLGTNQPPPELWTVSLPREPQDGPVTWSGERAGFIVTRDPSGPDARAAGDRLIREAEAGPWV
jgi:argininosuccinate lyase